MHGIVAELAPTHAAERFTIGSSIKFLRHEDDLHERLSDIHREDMSAAWFERRRRISFDALKVGAHGVERIDHVFMGVGAVIVHGDVQTTLSKRSFKVAQPLTQQHNSRARNGDRVSTGDTLIEVIDLMTCRDINDV